MGGARRGLLPDLSGEVLEIGAGTGVNFQYYSPEARVTAIEPSPNFSKRAETKLAGAQAAVELKQADVQHLPFADDAFDAAVATLVFCTIPDPMVALAEVHRVTKPGAPMLLIEHVRAQSPIKRFILNLWGPCHKVLFVGCHLNRDTEAKVRAAGFQVQEVRQLALEAGLVPIILIRAINPEG
jgi:ubiquinone/menaquinone biosynthesis C-methylase UbiE